MLRIAPHDEARGGGAGGACQLRVVVVASGSCRCFGLRFGFLRSSKQVKGWRLFRIADGQARFPSDPGGRGARLSARRETPAPMGQKPNDPEDKDEADRSDVRQKCVRFERARSGLEPVKRAGASPSCLRNVSRCLSSQPYPFDSPMRGGSGRLPSGAREARLSSSDGSLCHNSAYL